MLMVSHEKLVKIAGHRGHRNVFRRHAKGRRVRKCGWKNRKLHATCKGKLLLNLPIFNISLQGAPGGDIAQRCDKYGKSVGLDAEHRNEIVKERGGHEAK